MTNTERFALAIQALDELSEIAEARRAELGYDFKYQKTLRESVNRFPSCWYVDESGDGPSCIIGVWLHDKRGVGLAELSRIETTSIYAAINHPGFSGVEWDADMRAVLARVQEEQDDGRGWCAAVQSAREELKFKMSEANS